MVSAPFASFFGLAGTLAFHGSLRPSPSAALSSATITSPVVATNTSTGGSSWYSMLAPLCRFWSSEQAMIFAVTVADVLGLPQRAAEIHPVERQDDVGLAHQLARFLDDRVERLGVVVRVVAREHRALLEVGEHAGAEPLGEPDARLPELVLARAAAEQDERLLGALDRIATAWSSASFDGPRRLRRLEALHVRPLRLLVELGLLEAGVETRRRPARSAPSASCMLRAHHGLRPARRPRSADRPTS